LWLDRIKQQLMMQSKQLPDYCRDYDSLLRSRSAGQPARVLSYQSRQRAARALKGWLISTGCLCAGAARSHEQAGGGSPRPLGKPSVSAAADDRFAQLDVVRLTIPLATTQS
jgi:hypothetical protein